MDIPEDIMSLVIDDYLVPLVGGDFAGTGVYFDRFTAPAEITIQDNVYEYWKNKDKYVFKGYKEQ